MVRYVFWLKPIVNEQAAPRPAPRRVTPMTTNNPSAQQPSAFAAARQQAPVPAAAAAGPAPAFGGGGGAPRPARTGGDDVIKTVKREEPKVGRNDPCPCGSGKKYKKCHGAAA
jgi:hypothetical protein